MFLSAEAQPMSFSTKLLTLNWLFLLLITAIAVIGVAVLYSVAGGSFQPWAERQVVRYCVGLGIIFVVATVDIRLWLRAAYPVYLLALVFLIAVPLLGVENGGAKRWLAMGPYTFQPAELMKVALILALARYYQGLPARQISNPLMLLVPIALIALPTALVIQQPDLGTALLFACVGVGLMLLAGVSWVYFLLGGTAVLAAIPYFWEWLHPYQRERILTFIEPDSDPLGTGYHILQSKIALGSGGLIGKGFMQGTQSQLNFLPEKHTDFIFTMFAEEMGFVGGMILLSLYLLVLLSITYMAIRCRSPFGRLVAGGVGITLFIYVFINVAMVMGLVPVVGVPLPLVSYGGTALLTVMFGFGLVLNAQVHERREFERADLGRFF